MRCFELVVSLERATVDGAERETADEGGEVRAHFFEFSDIMCSEGI